MAPDPKIRASDDDRDRAVSLLREHHAVGRLTAEEFNERLDKAYEAKTLGDLDELLADLPAIDLYRLPDASLPRYRHPGASGLTTAGQVTGVMARGHGRFSPAWQAVWGSWLCVSLVCFVVWAISSPGGYPWPVWIAGPWGALLFARWITGSHPQGSRRGHDHQHELPGEHD